MDYVQKICPVKNPKYTNTSSPDCYAAMAKDDIRKESSSGGIFPVLAYKCLENGGYVAGAVWEGQRVIHIVSNKKKILRKCVSLSIFKAQWKNVTVKLKTY